MIVLHVVCCFAKPKYKKSMNMPYYALECLISSMSSAIESENNVQTVAWQIA